MKIKIIKFDNYVSPPSRKHYNDAGADVYSTVDLEIESHDTVKIPLGFGLELPDNLMGCIYPRTSLVAKGLISHIPPIDSGYRGEIHAIVTNMSSDKIIINKGDRIAQLVVLPICICDFVENLGEERNDGAFGSTGMK
jgi:dUTP pyrophosphatase